MDSVVSVSQAKLIGLNNIKRRRDLHCTRICIQIYVYDVLETHDKLIITTILRSILSVAYHNFSKFELMIPKPRFIIRSENFQSWCGKPLINRVKPIECIDANISSSHWRTLATQGTSAYSDATRVVPGVMLCSLQSRTQGASYCGALRDTAVHTHAGAPQHSAAAFPPLRARTHTHTYPARQINTIGEQQRAIEIACYG